MAVVRSQLPQVNLSDIPELLPGAQPSATPATRAYFEERCQKLYADDVEAKVASQISGVAPHITVDELEAMFPSLDPALVQSLASDAPTPRLAMETLLAITAAVAEPVVPSLPPKELGLESTDAFPSLVDADGWQVASQYMFERDADEDLGSAWSDRAKAIANKPAPQPAIAPASVSALRRRSSKKDEVSQPNLAQLETDYEFRQRLGKQRVQNRARFSRRVVATTDRNDRQLEDPSMEGEQPCGNDHEPESTQNVSADAM